MFGRSSGRIDLPSVPAALARIIQITSDENATAEQVARVVMLDQSLATKVLRIANSAYYGRLRKAETVTEAVVSLGFSSVRNLAASASVIEALFPKQMFPGFSWQDMWTHSVTCALATEAIYARIVRGAASKMEAAFVAGLLHDVGKLIIARALPQKFVQIVDICREYGYEMTRAEKSVLSTDHAGIGAELAKEWDFPPKLRAGIAYHHNPSIADDHYDMAIAVQAANMLAKRLTRSYIVGSNTEISLRKVAEIARLPVSEIDYVVVRVREGLNRCSDILSWSREMPGADLVEAA
ncbi:MAG: HDOD domain-containing protein [Armatimonadetes bacterium]|nr:HDOD domain-containing protein [Armatimonadota bacterium]